MYVAGVREMGAQENPSHKPLVVRCFKKLSTMPYCAHLPKICLPVCAWEEPKRPSLIELHRYITFLFKTRSHLAFI